MPPAIGFFEVAPERYLVDRFSTVDGVSQIRLGGDRRYAMRIWLDRARLAARGLTGTGRLLLHYQ